MRTGRPLPLLSVSEDQRSTLESWLGDQRRPRLWRFGQGSFWPVPKANQTVLWPDKRESDNRRLGNGGLVLSARKQQSSPIWQSRITHRSPLSGPRQLTRFWPLSHDSVRGLRGQDTSGKDQRWSTFLRNHAHQIGSLRLLCFRDRMLPFPLCVRGFGDRV